MAVGGKAGNGKYVGRSKAAASAYRREKYVINNGSAKNIINIMKYHGGAVAICRRGKIVIVAIMAK
jgi:hypothetical protein